MSYGEYTLPEPTTTATETEPTREWRVTSPMRPPETFGTRFHAYRYALHVPDPTIHVREHYDNGGTSGWREDT